MSGKKPLSRMALYALLVASSGLGHLWAQPLPAAGSAAFSEGVRPGGPPNAFYAFLGTPAPANGSLLVAVPSGAVRAELRYGDGSIIELADRMFQRFMILTPRAPLQPGASCDLTLYGSGPTSRIGMYVDFGALRTPHRPDISLTLSLALESKETEAECCGVLANVAVDRTCFATRLTNKVAGKVDLVTSEDASSLTQLLFRVRAVGAASAALAEFQPWTQLNVYWETQAAEYCIEVDAMEIGSGEIYPYPELAGRCAPHAALGEVGDIHLPIDAARVLAHETCLLPPSDLAELWCTTNQAECESTEVTWGCQGYGHVCRGEPLPKVESSTERLEREEREERAEDFKPKRLDQSLCSVTHVHGGSAWVWTLVCLARLPARKRASRRKPL